MIIVRKTNIDSLKVVSIREAIARKKYMNISEKRYEIRLDPPSPPAKNFMICFFLAMASLIKSLGENVKMLVTNPKDEKNAEAEGGDDDEDNDDDNDPDDDDDAG